MSSVASGAVLDLLLLTRGNALMVRQGEKVCQLAPNSVQRCPDGLEPGFEVRDAGRTLSTEEATGRSVRAGAVLAVGATREPRGSVAAMLGMGVLGRVGTQCSCEETV